MIVRKFTGMVGGLVTYILLENFSKLLSPFCSAKIILFVRDGEIDMALYWSIVLIVANFFGITFSQNGWA